MKVEFAVLGSRPNEPYGFCGRKATLNHAYIGIGHSLSLICQPTSEDMEPYFVIIIIIIIVMVNHSSRAV